MGVCVGVGGRVWVCGVWVYVVSSETQVCSSIPSLLLGLGGPYQKKTTREVKTRICLNLEQNSIDSCFQQSRIHWVEQEETTKPQDEIWNAQDDKKSVTKLTDPN